MTRIEGNSVHYNARKEREKAIVVLEKAKQIDRKMRFVPKGYSPDFLKFQIKMSK